MQPPTFATVTIERILPGGLGLAHIEGFTLFVGLAAPGDVVRVRINRIRGKVLWASIEEIIQPGPERVEAPCPYFGVCGGCDFQQLSYRAQLKAKTEIIRDCLRRIAQIESPPEIAMHPALQEWQYRARANWQLDPVTQRLGYFESGSRRVCDVDVCAVLAPRLQAVLGRVRAELQAGSVDDLPRDIRAVVGDDDLSVAPPLAEFQLSDISLAIGGETYYFNAESFFQATPGLLEGLIAEAIRDVRGELAIDLYSGAGLFTLPLARRFTRVFGVEVNTRAATYAVRNLQHARLENAEIVTGDVGQWLRGQAGSFSQVDFLLLDPPRAGAENIVIKGILELNPHHISYVSCDPATLARDLKKLLAAGYALSGIAAFDMFPQTHHVETVAHLERI